jgi:hypothetical protein
MNSNPGKNKLNTSTKKDNSGSGKNANIRQSMLKLKTHSDFRDFFLNNVV